VRENGKIVRAHVPAPADPSKTPLTGKGWTLELKPGWLVISEGKRGDFTVRKKAN